MDEIGFQLNKLPLCSETLNLDSLLGPSTESASNKLFNINLILISQYFLCMNDDDNISSK